MTRGVDIHSEGLGMRKWLTPALNLVRTFQIPGELFGCLSSRQEYVSARDSIRQLELSHQFGGGGGDHFHSVLIPMSRPCPSHSPEEKKLLLPPGPVLADWTNGRHLT